MMTFQFKRSILELVFWFFVYLGFFVPLENFSLMFTITCEGLQILTYTRHSWPLRSEDPLTCHTYFDTGLPFIIAISEDPWHSHRCQAFGSGAVTTCFSDLGLSRPGIELWCPTYKANALPLRHRGGRRVRKTTYKNFLVGWCLLLLGTEV